MQNRINIITDYNEFFGQSLYPWDSLDLDKLKKEFLASGFDVRVFQISDVFNKNLEILGEIILYTSSQKYNYKTYIEDLIYYFKEKNNILIPSYDILKAHENKGFQEILKKIKGIKGMNALYFGNPAEIDFSKITFPIVLKKVNGAGSTGVFLVHNKKECLRVIKNISRKEINFYDLINNIKELGKRILFRNRLNPSVCDYRKRQVQFVLQEFVPNLKFDYKVLIFFDKYYVLKRNIKKDDFRASGSGNFVFEAVESELLDYAKEIYVKLDVPFISLDICFDGDTYQLIEFQGTHFGPFTLMYSEGYYQKANSDWHFIKANSDLEKEYSVSLLKFLKLKNIISCE